MGTIDRRMAELKVWLSGIDSFAVASIRPASVDASFRRYFRVEGAEGSFIAMDAPPEHMSSLPFMRVAGYFEEMGLNAPRIVGANVEGGFLLLTDLGSTQYLDAVKNDPDSAPKLYADALSALNVLQKRGAAYQSALPPYDETLLHFELSIFRDWLCDAHLGITFSERDEESWDRVSDLLVQNALDQPRVFVHRDFHSRNLMVTERENPGILDFQDAVEGPLTYDIVSLLKDCYFRLPPQHVREWALRFYAGLNTSIRQQVDEQIFTRYFDLMGVQRHLKASGIFARLNHRDGKPGYVGDIPRTLKYIVDLAPQYDELFWLITFVQSRCLPKLEASE